VKNRYARKPMIKRSKQVYHCC